MNKREYLLTCLSEECCEVAQVTAKIQKFTLEGCHPDTPQTNNEQQLVDELNDLQAVINMLVDDGAIPMRWYNLNKQAGKKERVEEYMLLSDKLGTLEDV